MLNELKAMNNHGFNKQSLELMAQFFTFDGGGYGASVNDDSLTFFGQLADEKAEEAEANNSGVLANIFGRFWKTDTSVNIDASSNHNCSEKAVLEDFDQIVQSTSAPSSSNGIKNRADKEDVLQDCVYENSCRSGIFQAGVSQNGASTSTLNICLYIRGVGIVN
uniref:Uncharacterized protein n=1 Tax=Heterorhabditis bacteriophora TaxID=37862 RepID=A0A1I7XUW7_HETBA